MEISNWIALGALLIATIGLIPQFHQAFQKSRKTKEKEEEQIDNSKERKEEKEQTPMPFMLRILMMIVFAFSTLLIELIIFSWLAHFFEIEIDLETMPLNWQVGFYSMFAIPGVFVFLAIVTLSANSTD